MPRYRAFAQVDVFSPIPFRGNPVAVVCDAVGLDSSAMQDIARWTNLSETTFLLPAHDAAADYRVRIFTPEGELPFAGHPTLGSAHAWLDEGGTPGSKGKVVQECGVGLVEIRTEPTLSFAAPPTIRTGPLETDFLESICRALGITSSEVVAHQWVDNGPGWAVVELSSAAEVLGLTPDFSRVGDAMVGVLGRYDERGGKADFEIRAFAPGVGVAEDPVTGSLNASVAQWLYRTRQMPPKYTVSQGTQLSRKGELSIEYLNDTVWIGGETHTLLRGGILA